MKKNPNFQNIDRNATLVQAITKEGHKGYQLWHRNYDSIVTSFLQSNPNITVAQLEKYLNKLYSTGDLYKIFGDVIIKLFNKGG